MNSLKKIIFLFTLFCHVLVNVQAQNKIEMQDITLQISEKQYDVHLEESDEARHVFSRLPLKLNMTEWRGNNEYYCALEKKIAVKQNTTVTQFVQGDIALYNGVSLVIFYERTNNMKRICQTGGYQKFRNRRVTVHARKRKREGSIYNE